MFCPKCGTELKQQENGALYCNNCNIYFKYNKKTGTTKQIKEKHLEEYEQTQDVFREEKSRKICPVCNKEQFAKNIMCINCGYDFVSETEYIKPAKSAKASNISYTNAAFSARKNQTHKAICVVTIIFAILLVVAIISSSCYCTTPIAYGIEYSMHLHGFMHLPDVNGVPTIVEKMTFVFRPDNTFVLSSDNVILAYGFYSVRCDNMIFIDDSASACGISSLEIADRNKLYIRDSHNFDDTRYFVSSAGLDIFLIITTILIGIIEIISLVVLCYRMHR